MGTDLVAHYRDYLDVLNERRFADLTEHIADHVSYNGTSISLADYRDARSREAELIPDLSFHAARIVADVDNIAAILLFRCTPVDEFAGHRFGGRTITFTEHVFYRYEHRRVTEVVSLLDLAALQRQADAG